VRGGGASARLLNTDTLGVASLRHGRTAAGKVRVVKTTDFSELVEALKALVFKAKRCVRLNSVHY
jgi:hypothetical protein